MLRVFCYAHFKNLVMALILTSKNSSVSMKKSKKTVMENSDIGSLQRDLSKAGSKLSDVSLNHSGV